MENIGFTITEFEIIQALEDTNPNKSIGVDNLSLKPLDLKECVWIELRGLNYIEYMETYKRKMKES